MAYNRHSTPASVGQEVTTHEVKALHHRQADVKHFVLLSQELDDARDITTLIMAPKIFMYVTPRAM